ncbi:unnamed protein product [Rotaria magnacalcarata]|uniref:Uncharacterized protein n=1 Tax=Rotaria magnacalcarata TaxID=392030 RepID=A0A816DZ03_9BILA|nr:unnamed protein product [Rotaria magnacalcarata]CAF1640931.1 unnamed protein product [Rotaria magnacalcarata]CAF2246685.1 unnamed protein product [Rotaria magnacalcarata]CAF3989014.1 unnamed protein product [Rotaria magnacalcarata]CAF4006702.1 unnamed protein product [Rotaria magnacalcarata]
MNRILEFCLVRILPLLPLRNGNKCKVSFYGIIGDCPALKLILEFIGHTGYYSCFYCYIHDVHVGGRGGKRQYYHENNIKLRHEQRYELESIRAIESSNNIYGHLGRSLLHDLLDIPLPHSIIVDYLHVSLLRHTRCILQQIYAKLSPAKRIILDQRLRSQKFPHFFNRKIRAVSDFSFIKATELKNLLLYALIPHMLYFLPKEQLAHLASYIIHGKKCFDDNTSSMSKELFLKYYQDHSVHYDDLQNLVLHLRLHFNQLFDNHGSLCYLGTFGQEDLIGAIGKSHHGTRFHGQLIAYHYEIDFALRNKTPLNRASSIENIDGPLDEVNETSDMLQDVTQHHRMICNCNKPEQLTSLSVYGEHD